MIDPRIAALLEEREGYVRAGYLDRVPDVDAVLASLGYVDDKPETTEPEPIVQETTAVEPAPEQAVPPKPRRRGRPPKNERQQQ